MDFTDYYAARRTSLVRAVVLLGCPLDEAEDVVQTGLLKCYRSWSRVTAAANPEAYVYAALVNAWRDAARKRGRSPIPSADLPDRPVDGDPSVGVAVRSALLLMSREHREVLVLRYYADLSEREIADALGCRPGTVKSLASRAIDTLRQELPS